MTRARATPKNPNCASLRVTTFGIQMVAETPKPAIAMLVITADGRSTRQRTSPNNRNQPVNHHSADVVASEITWRTGRARPVAQDAAHRAQQAIDARTTISQAGPRVYAPTPPPGGRRQARRYTRCTAVVNELAKKIVSTRPSNPVALRTSSADANASLAVVERVTPYAESAVNGGEDRGANAGGAERGDDDHQREERHERLAGEGDAAIDELDLEQPFPHTPEQHPLRTIAHRIDAAPYVRAPVAEWTDVRWPWP